MILQDYNISNDKPYDEQLRILCEKRAKEIYGERLPSRIVKRINLELEFICAKKAAYTFLNIANMMHVCCFTDKYERSFRGTLGASLVAYLCGITPFNPMEVSGMELYPEMFFGAVKPADCDGKPLRFDINLTEKAKLNFFRYSVNSERKITSDMKLYDDTFNLRVLERLQKETKDIYIPDAGGADVANVMAVFDDMYINPANKSAFGLLEFQYNVIAEEVLKREKHMDFEILVKCIGLSRGDGTWFDNAERHQSIGLNIRETIACVEDVYECLLKHGICAEDAFEITDRVRKETETLLESDIVLMKQAGISGRFIKSCQKIRFLLPRAHLICHALENQRLAYYLTYHRDKYFEVIRKLRHEMLSCNNLMKYFIDIRLQEEETYYFYSPLHIDEIRRFMDIAGITGEAMSVSRAKKSGWLPENYPIPKVNRDLRRQGCSYATYPSVLISHVNREDFEKKFMEWLNSDDGNGAPL